MPCMVHRHFENSQTQRELRQHQFSQTNSEACRNMGGLEFSFTVTLVVIDLATLCHHDQFEEGMCKIGVDKTLVEKKLFKAIAAARRS